MSEYNFNFWDERFSSREFIYGTKPNSFFKEQIDKIVTRGRLLLPGEGEGRNAIYAALSGWQVDAFDQSRVAKEKATLFADKSGVKINYTVSDLQHFIPEQNVYSVAAVIFVHLFPFDRIELHKKLIGSLKIGGKLIIELFSKNQLGKVSGGPQDLLMLTSIEELKTDFEEMKTILLEEKDLFLDEGPKHSGEASVVRFVGEKVK